MKRLIKERDDLKIKTDALHNFLHSKDVGKVHKIERMLLSDQLTHMKAYLGILDARLGLYD